MIDKDILAVLCRHVCCNIIIKLPCKLKVRPSCWFSRSKYNYLLKLGIFYPLCQRWRKEIFEILHNIRWSTCYHTFNTGPRCWTTVQFSSLFWKTKCYLESNTIPSIVVAICPVPIGENASLPNMLRKNKRYYYLPTTCCINGKSRYPTFWKAILCTIRSIASCPTFPTVNAG